MQCELHARPAAHVSLVVTVVVVLVVPVPVSVTLPVALPVTVAAVIVLVVARRAGLFIAWRTRSLRTLRDVHQCHREDRAAAADGHLGDIDNVERRAGVELPQRGENIDRKQYGEWLGEIDDPLGRLNIQQRRLRSGTDLSRSYLGDAENLKR